MSANQPTRNLFTYVGTYLGVNFVVCYHLRLRLLDSILCPALLFQELSSNNRGNNMTYCLEHVFKIAFVERGNN